jgi:hypothetical protein
MNEIEAFLRLKYNNCYSGCYIVSFPYAEYFYILDEKFRLVFYKTASRELIERVKRNNPVNMNMFSEINRDGFIFLIRKEYVQHT